MLHLSRRTKQFLSVFTLLLTAIVFGYFFVRHPSIRHQLTDTPPVTLLVLLGLYLLFTVSIGAILAASVRMCGAIIPKQEAILVTMYSAIINFFGPLQSGPAFRAAYLRAKHSVSLRRYGAVSLVYYALYGIFSVVLLFMPVLRWYAPLALGVLLVVGFIGWRYVPRVRTRMAAVSSNGLGGLIVATLIQVLIMVAVYYVELHDVVHHLNLLRVMSYSGAANLALFVSLTPGAIGFRESFLVFSERLHRFDGHDIVTANIIDRAVYIVMLLLLLVIILLTHARSRFNINKDE